MELNQTRGAPSLSAIGDFVSHRPQLIECVEVRTSAFLSVPYQLYMGVFFARLRICAHAYGLAEPLWTNPGVKSEISVSLCEPIFTF